MSAAKTFREFDLATKAGRIGAYEDMARIRGFRPFGSFVEWERECNAFWRFREHDTGAHKLRPFYESTLASEMTVGSAATKLLTRMSPEQIESIAMQVTDDYWRDSMNIMVMAELKNISPWKSKLMQLRRIFL